MFPKHLEASLVEVSNELDLSVESWLYMMGYTIVNRADTLDPLFCWSIAPFIVRM